MPQIREHVELTHRYNAFYDNYDDGKLDGTTEMIADAGVDVLETCTPPPVGDFDLVRAKSHIGGRATIKGYVDLLYVIKHGTPDLVEETVRDAMEVAKPRGRVHHREFRQLPRGHARGERRGLFRGLQTLRPVLRRRRGKDDDHDAQRAS